MRPRGIHALAAALIGLGWAAGPGAAYAGSSTTMSQAEMRRTCTEQGGRFGQFWRYDDQGMQWGQVLLCTTNTGSVTCQDQVCQSTQWDRPDEVTAADSGTDSNRNAARFPARPAAFANALAELAKK